MNLLDFLGGPFKTILDKVVPDAAQREQYVLQATQLAQAGEFKELDAQLQQNLAQIDVNKTEAGSGSFFRAGWRPAVGWICAAGVGIQFVVAPMATWLAGLAGHPLTFPTLDMATLMPLLMGLLGMGTLRTVEKVKGLS